MKTTVIAVSYRDDDQETHALLESFVTSLKRRRIAPERALRSKETVRDTLPRKPRKQKNASRRWSEDDKEFLKSHAGHWRADLIARRLCRTKAAVAARATQLGVSLLKRRSKLQRVV